MYTVAGFALTRTYRVLWTLEELGLPYTHNPLRPGSAEMKAINPSGKVPALLVDDEVLTDSVAIMTYLADKHGQLLDPPGSLHRAKQDAMIHQVLDEVDALLWLAARHKFVLPPERRVPEIRDSLIWEINRNLDNIAEGFATPFLVGDTFSLADIMLEHCVGWAKSLSIPISNRKVLDHVKTLRARSAFQRIRPLLA